jgi:hypothetical protein
MKQIWHFYSVKVFFTDGKNEEMTFPRIVDENYEGCILTEDDVRSFFKNFAPYRYSILKAIEMPLGPSSTTSNLHF